ncbi:hypothetical protein [Myroides indicus]|uniref:Uncharacterized protein n=1 Tax=Myroides indicus TaxID=1323422 RepID=A0A4R7F2T0_9FLAO|nr:hypothetical protein [Myroides indicus]TDS60245.1 hypothetical protein C8P70_109102 [Myroides indicus]
MGFSTPGNLVIEGVGTPSGGPFEVKVFVRALDCNPFAPNCSANIGGMQEYFASYSFSSTGSPPSAINFGGLSMLNSICCN